MLANNSVKQTHRWRNLFQFVAKFLTRKRNLKVPNKYIQKGKGRTAFSKISIFKIIQVPKTSNSIQVQKL